MEALNCTDYFSCVESCPLLAELHVSSQMPEEFTAVQEIHDEVEFFLCLESIVKVHDKGVPNFLQDIPLR